MSLSALTPFGLKCRELRLKMDRRVIEHADALKLEPAEITDYETGQKIPSEEYVRQTAFWLRVQPVELESLLLRRPVEGRVIKFTDRERRSLRESNRLLQKAPSLSAFIMQIEDYRGGGNNA